MIQDIRLHGQINEKVEYYVTVAGRNISNRYFHEIGEKKGDPFVRLFSSGNEYKITPSGISYRAFGGSFCEYMFGIDLPKKDLVKKDVLNRLVMYGAVYSAETERISFTEDLYGEEGFDHVFFNGHAVGNYHFFVHTDAPVASRRKRQESVLRAVGKYLKHTDKVGKADDSGLIRDLFLELKEEDSILFLIRLVHRYHDEYYRLFRELYWKTRSVDEEGSLKLAKMAELYEIDRYQQERIRIDVMYKHPENKRIVDEYKGILIDCSYKKELDHQDMAKLTRLRTLSIRNRISLNLFDTLDELLLKGKKIKEYNEPEHIMETRAIFEGLFLKGHTGGHMNDEDLVKLLHAKHQSIMHRDNAFEEILLETCRLTDEKAAESNDMSLFESFGYIVTFFDRFDTTYATISKISFMEDAEVREDQVRSLLGNKKAFDEVSPGLFHELFIQSALQNKYMTNYGRLKVATLYRGVLDIEEGNASIKEVLERLNEIIREERYYADVHSFMKEKIKKFYSDLSDKESQDQFIAESWKEMLDKRLIPGDAPEKVFRNAVINIRKEAFYLNNMLPLVIAGSNSKLREDFLENSGLDRFYVEDLEREYFEKNNLNTMLLDRIRKDQQAACQA
ncbi:MAG: TIGR04442 family protein [Nitrospirae bacterium]|nr:TIGR04442 family protein [Nitrospirota bacterium]MBI5695401.1 TIGR04442 family protein [Nitrospirota bacterium]